MYVYPHIDTTQMHTCNPISFLSYEHDMHHLRMYMCAQIDIYAHIHMYVHLSILHSTSHTQWIMYVSHSMHHVCVTLNGSCMCHTQCIMYVSHSMHHVCVTLNASCMCHTQCIMYVSHSMDHVCVRMHAHTHTRVYMYVSSHVCVRMHTHTHTCMHVCK